MPVQIPPPLIEPPTTTDQMSTRKSPLKRIAKIVAISVAVIAGLGVALVAFEAIIFVVALSTATNSCSKGREQLFGNEQSITNRFNALLFIPSQPNVKAEISKQPGDCIDSMPTIHATKSYDVSMPAGTLFDEIKKVLVEAGYTADGGSPNIPDNPCEYEGQTYEFTNTNPDREIEIKLSCAQYTSTKDWREIRVTRALVDLYVAWHYST